MTKKKKEEKKDYHCIDIKFTGIDLHYLVKEYVKEKLGDVDIMSLELTNTDDGRLGVLNSDVSNFKIFVEYERN